MTGTRAPAGHGRGVVLVPGFANPAIVLRPLGSWLTAGGWNVTTAPVRWNVGCASAVTERVIEAARNSARRTGSPVVLIGHSRGGLLCRVAALRAAAEVAELITVCTPWTLEAPRHLGVERAAAAVRTARGHGWLPAFASVDCARGSCCDQFRQDMTRRPPQPWSALYSTVDRVAGAAAIPPPSVGRAVDVGIGHLAAVLAPAGWMAVGAALSDPPPAAT